MSVSQELFDKMAEMKRAHTPFALATVIDVKGSSSGKVGDKALYDEQGQRILGWVGGGCVERMSGEASQQALDEGIPRTIHVNLDGDDLLMAIPCGGEMTIMVEPQLTSPILVVSGAGRVVETLTELGRLLDFRVVVQTFKDEASRFPEAFQVITDHLDLERLQLAPDYVVLASHHPNDNMLALQALKMDVPFVAVVASQKRSGLIAEYLLDNGLEKKDLDRYHAPAGLDLKAETPEGIALSIMAEIVMHRNGGTGRPLHQRASAKGAKKTDTVPAGGGSP